MWQHKLLPLQLSLHFVILHTLHVHFTFSLMLDINGFFIIYPYSMRTLSDQLQSKALLQIGLSKASFACYMIIQYPNKHPPYDIIQNTQVLHYSRFWFGSASGITITDTSPALAFSANEKTVFQFWKTVIMSFVNNSTNTYLVMLFPLIWIVLQLHRVH